MHQLHLVGFTADHDGLIFSTKKGATSGAYVVAVDDALFSALEEARRMAMAEPDDAAARAAADRVRSLRPTQRSNLSVRDIQSRLRSGMTLAQVAAEAGVDEDWVARFAAPVVAEQAAVIDRAMAFSFTTPRRGASSRPLGEAVRWNLVDRGIVVDTSPQAAGWSAFQLEPGRWAVRFTYSSRGRAQVAEWEVDLEAGELTGRNRLAGDLAYVEAGARRRKPIEVAPPPPPAPKKATAGRKGTPARTRTARAQAAHATSSKAAAARAKAAKASPPKAPTAKRSAAADRKQASSGPAPGNKQSPSPPERAGVGRSGAAERATPVGRSGGSGRPTMAGASPSAAEDRRPIPPTVPRPLGATPGRIGGSSPAGPSSEQSTANQAGARFPAPRPAAGRTDAPPPRRSQPAAGQAPAASPPVVRVPPPAAPRPRPPAAQPPPQRQAPPDRVPSQITADARPIAATTGDGPRAPSTPPVRRLPAATGTAASRRAERGRPAPAPAPAPPAAPAPAAPAPAAAAPAPPAAAAPAPTPSPAPAPQPETPAPDPAPEARPAPPRPAPAVRPVGGADGRPTILIIDADRAGDRRRS